MKAVSISKKSCLPGKILHFCDQVITKLIMQIAQIIKKGGTLLILAISELWVIRWVFMALEFDSK